MFSMFWLLLSVALLLPTCFAQDDIDISLVEDAPPPVIVKPPLDVATNKPTVLTTTSAAPMPEDTAAVEGRSNELLEARDGDCSKQPVGPGPVPSSDTVDAFLKSTTLQSMAQQASTPDDYFSIFKNANASVAGSTYMGLYTLTSYNTSACAAVCNSVNGCLAFNIFIERDPSLDPNAQNCPNPPSTINYRCTVWGAPISASLATQTGQWRAKFQVAVTGSNGYNVELAASRVSGFNAPVPFGNASINAPLSPASYMGYQWFPFSQSQGFSAQTCATYCQAQTFYNKNHPNPDCSYTPCTFFNAYVLSKNTIPQGLYCAIYNSTWSASYATNHAHYDQSGNNYTVSQSYGYSIGYYHPQPVYDDQCGAPFIKDPDFDSPDLNTYPYLSPYWNYTTTGSASANGGWSPGYGNSRFMFGAGLYSSSSPFSPAPSVTLSQVLTTIPQGTYTLGFYYKFDAGMDVCQIGLVFPDPKSYGPATVSLAGKSPGTWYEAVAVMNGGGTETLGFVFSCPGANAPGGQIFLDSIYLAPDWPY